MLKAEIQRENWNEKQDWKCFPVLRPWDKNWTCGTLYSFFFGMADWPIGLSSGL